MGAGNGRLDGLAGSLNGRALIQRHDDVGAENLLIFDGQLRAEEMLRAVDVRAEGDALVAHFPQRRQGKYLVAAGIGQERAVPAHELMQPAVAGDDIGAGPQVEVVVIG